MNNLELTKFGVQELKKDEMINVEGGKIPWKQLRNYGSKFLELVGVYDAIADFKEGWDSVDCSCSK
ncbi:hypothetical protein ORI89_16235 [Sphingobacterium sp. UT-1RO-CII-1]|uniref:hypothetical protein n=1 Tax=Sphingobacterium sp. UT-1RO-CII-1 TaxID=2995225 RepID=UPI00227C95D8|nr:hypothetical protein [Sphingobacterium sp. UT-1RO-CII-1]MCY4781212.1 hypothetical protein [Sphingobacterium sp. UT-1RO-CII-1]